MAKGFMIDGIVSFPYATQAALEWALLIGERVRLLVEGGWCVLAPAVTPRERKTTDVNLTGTRCDFLGGNQTVHLTFFDHGEVVLQIGDVNGLLKPTALRIYSAPIAVNTYDQTMKGVGPEWYVFGAQELVRLHRELQCFDPPTLLSKD